MEQVIGGKFKLGRKIGSGSFGELYLGIYRKKLLPSITSAAFWFHPFLITWKAFLMFLWFVPLRCQYTKWRGSGY